jgi:hypothetical protein
MRSARRVRRSATPTRLSLRVVRGRHHGNAQAIRESLKGSLIADQQWIPCAGRGRKRHVGEKITRDARMPTLHAIATLIARTAMTTLATDAHQRPKPTNLVTSRQLNYGIMTEYDWDETSSPRSASRLVSNMPSRDAISASLLDHTLKPGLNSTAWR